MGNSFEVPKEVIEFPCDKEKTFKVRFEHCGS